MVGFGAWDDGEGGAERLAKFAMKTGLFVVGGGRRGRGVVAIVQASKGRGLKPSKQ